MKNITKPLSELTPDPRNARKHPPEQIARLAGSIKEFGFLAPILINAKGTIIAGHGRVEAARKACLEEVPCLQVEHLTETQQRAYVLADNKLAQMAEWDDEMLALELKSLVDAGFDIDLTGFMDHELGDLLEADQIVDEADEIIHEQSLQVEPEQEYVIVLASSDEEWEQMKEELGLKMVRKGGYKKGSAFDAVGLGRVISYQQIKDNVNSNTK